MEEDLFSKDPLCELHIIEDDEDDGDEFVLVEDGDLGLGSNNIEPTDGVGEELGDGKEEEEEKADNSEILSNPPVVGMVFESVEHMEDFYCVFAKASGFGVIRSAHYCDRQTKLRKLQYWHCDRGPPSKCKKISSPEVVKRAVRRKKSKKCGCRAGIVGFLNADGLWQIRSVVLEHTGHEVKPSGSRFIPCWRKIPKHLYRFIKDLTDAGVNHSQIYGALANQLSGFDKVPFLLSDLHNYHARNNSESLLKGDLTEMFQVMEKMKEKNPDFFFSYRGDKDSNLTDIVWVDARSRAAYKDFSDVVCFDATYITNKYELPFANFVGVNHHGQTILLGCALVSHENAETYKWVMGEWLKAMDGKAPGGIITDQSTPMRQAIEYVFPETRHRLCVWHILSKVPKKLLCLPRVKEFHWKMRCVVYDSLDAMEFERRWRQLMSEFGVEGNLWLQSLYADRRIWVPAYVKDCFWAGMSTTQRVESIHHFFKGFMCSKTTLKEFVLKYSRAIAHRTNAEEIADSIDSRRRNKLMTHLMVEKFFEKVYTDTKLKEVQDECTGLIHCVPNGVSQLGDGSVEYFIQDRVWSGEPGQMGRRDHHVVYKKESDEFRCECRLFESRGILCRHIIRVMDMLGMPSVPEKYVLDRWRKDIRREHLSIKVSFSDPLRAASDLRYSKLQFEFEKVFDIARESEELCEHATVAAGRLLTELEGIRGGSRTGGNCDLSQNTSAEASAGLEMINLNENVDAVVSGQPLGGGAGEGSRNWEGLNGPKPVKRPGRPKANPNTPAYKRARSNSFTQGTQSSVNQPVVPVKTKAGGRKKKGVANVNANDAGLIANPNDIINQIANRVLQVVADRSGQMNPPFGNISSCNSLNPSVGGLFASSSRQTNVAMRGSSSLFSEEDVETLDAITNFLVRKK